MPVPTPVRRVCPAAPGYDADGPTAAPSLGARHVRLARRCRSADPAAAARRAPGRRTTPVTTRPPRRRSGTPSTTSTCRRSRRAARCSTTRSAREADQYALVRRIDREDRRRRPGCDRPAGGVLLRDAVDRPGAAARAPTRRQRAGRGRRPLRRPGSRSATCVDKLGTDTDRHSFVQVCHASCRGTTRQPARQVRDDLAERPGRRPGDGRLDELHRLRGGAAVAGPLHRRRGLRPLRPVRPAVRADGPRPAAGHPGPADRGGAGSSSTWPSRAPPTRATRLAGAPPDRRSARAPRAAPARTAAPSSGSRCTPGTASAASPSPSRWPPSRARGCNVRVLAGVGFGPPGHPRSSRPRASATATAAGTAYTPTRS